eukprot:Em0112g3a
MAEDQAAVPRGSTILSLNSRRLTTTHIRQLAVALEIPTRASAADILRMIEGKITEDGRDPFNVQVVVKEGEDGGILLQLQDAEGVFLEADPPMEEEETEDVPQQEAAEQRENAEQEEDEESLKAKLDEVVKERDELKEALKTCKERLNAVWKANCAQLREFEEALKHAEDEARTLQKGAREKQQEARSTSPSGSDISEASTSKSTGKRVGKAPPIDSFSGDCYEVQLDDWLPSLERAAEWNRWSLEEKLMQLAGHLRGKALQEWTLISETERTTYVQAVAALRTRLDTGSKTLAAQDFRHLCQDEKESVSEYIRKLERTFRVAYGRDNMSQETRDTLLLGQMQEGLKHEVMKAPAVSGATSYKELCVAAKNEERRLKELQKREHYGKIGHPTPREPTRSNVVKPAEKTNSTRRCFKCHKDGHIARDCPGPEPESRSSGRSLHKQDGVRKIKVTDSGSKTHCVRLEVQKVPVYGLIDSGSDITIIGSSLFKRVAAVARLKKGSLMTADKTPRTYDQKTFSLDGRIDLELSFEGKSMKTPVYLKNDAHDQLLLSEGVCRQLGIITYHHLAEPWRGSKKADTRKSKDHAVTDAKVPRVVVNLVQSLHLPSYKSVVVPVQVSECTSLGAVLFEENSSIRELCGVIIVDSLIRPDGKGIAHVVAENRTGYTARLERGAEIGTAFPATVVKQTPSHTDFSKTFLLDTDACETGIGAVLSQEHDGLERVVAYASRTLSKAERKYCVTRKELLAVVTFMRHFRPYLLGHHFILRTDHSSLQWIYSMKEPEGQLARWLEQIQEFDVEVVHRRGKCHQNADALSRLQNADKSECPPKIKPPSQFSCSDGAKACTVQASKEPLSNIRELQGADEDVGPILQSVISRKVPDTSFCKGKSREFNQLVQQWEQLLFKNGILYRYHEDEGNSNVQVVVPKAARCQILKQLHEGAFGGHLGEAKTLKSIAKKESLSQSRAPLQSVTAGYPLQLVAVDIVGPLTPSKTENTYLLVASDYFTRWVEANPVLPHQYVKTLKDTLESAYTKARKHMHATAMRSEELYNRRVHGQEYEVGDLVWLNNPVVPRGRSRKLHCPWTGPFKIIKKLSSVVYRIQDKRPGSRKRVVVHFDRLKPCPADIRMKPVGEDLHNSDANEQPVQFPGSDLQFFEDDDHDVMVDSTETNVTRKGGPTWYLAGAGSRHAH